MGMIEMAPHLQHEKRQGQQRGDQHVAAQYGGVLVVVLMAGMAMIMALRRLRWPL